MPPFPQAIETALAACFARHQPRHIWVGFSGGVDSTALLLAAAAIGDVPVTAIHINHGLQAEAGDFEKHCRGLCARQGIALEVKAVDVGSRGNLEANARRARYEVFAECVGAGELLLLGHHADDQLETILQRLFRGRGLLPMREHGPVGAGQFVRPLLDVAAEELGAYVSECGEHWVDDPSNDDPHFERNFLRGRVLPVLLERWPALAEGVLRVAREAQHQSAALASAIAALGERVALSALPAARPARRIWLRTFLECHGSFGVADRAIDAFLDDLQMGRQAALHSSGGELRVWRGELYYVRPLPAVSDLPAGRELQVGDIVELPHGSLTVVSCTSGERLTLAFRQGGETLAQRHGRTDLSTVFAQAGIAPWWRDTYPLIMAGDQLLAVPGVAVAYPGDERSDEVCRITWQNRK